MNTDKASQVLGLAPTPLEAALRRGLEWYLTQPRRPQDYAREERLLSGM